MEKWSKLEDSLIDQVREHPILYRSNAKSYKHMLVKENTWKEIAASLGLTRRECKLKWKGIRDGYRRSRIMEMKGRVGRKSKYSDDRLLFLRTCHQEDETLKQEPEEPAPADATSESLQPYETARETAEIQFNVRNGDSSSYERDVLLEELRKGREERYELLRLLSNVSVQQAVTASESSTHSFFRSMADVVAQLPPHRIAEVRVKVCSLVSDVEMQVIQEGSPVDQLEISLHTPSTPRSDGKKR